MNSMLQVQHSTQRAWRQALPLMGFLLIATLLLFLDTASAMVTVWLRSDTFTHGFLVPPIVIWLVWRKRHVLASYKPQPSLWGVLLLVGAAFVWLLGDLVAVNAVTQLALVCMLVLLVPAVLGFAVARAIVFPLAFLFFAVPLGEFAMPQLMVWTADFTVLALRLTGIPVLREGLQFVIPSGNWSVVEACSGVRYLIASVTVGTLFAYLNYQSMSRRVLFIVVSVLVPVVANWLRAYMIVMLGHFSNNKLATGVDHLIYGWVFFGVVIMLMFMIGARWAEPELDAEANLGIKAVLPAQSDVVGAPPTLPGGFWRVHAATALALLVVLPAPHIARWLINASDHAATPLLLLPAVLTPAWTSVRVPVAEFKPDFQNPSASVNASYQSLDMRVGLYLGYYRQQDYSRKLVSSSNALVQLNDPTWAQVSAGTRSIDFAGQPTQLRIAELSGVTLLENRPAARLMVWQIYWINGTWIASDVWAKLYGAIYRLLGHGDDAAVVILYAPKGDAGEGEAALAAFVQANVPALVTLLQQIKEQR